jgi:hypothetical protein
LTPDRFFSRALVTNMVAHRREQRVGLVVTATKAEQEGSEHTICDQLRDSVCHIGSSNLSDPLSVDWKVSEVACLL